MSTSSFPGDTELIKPLLLGVSAIVIILVAYFSNDGGSSGATTTKKVSIVTSSSTTATTTVTSKKGASKKKKPVTTTTTTLSKSPPPRVATASPPPPPKVEKKVATVVEKKVVIIQEPEPESTKSKKKKLKKKAGNAIASSASSALKPSSFTNGNSNGGGTKEEIDDSDEDEDDVELWRISSAAASKKAGAIDAAKRAASNKERDRIRALRRVDEKVRAEARAIEEEKAVKVALEAEKKAALSEAKKRVLEEAKLAMKKTDSSNGVAASVNNASTTNGGSNKVVANTAAKAALITNGTAAVAAAAVDPPGEKKKRKRSKKKGAGSAVPESRPALVKSAPSVEVWEIVPVVEEWQEVGTKKAKGKTEVVAPVTTSTTVSSSSITPGGDAAAGVGVEEFPSPAPLEVEETSVTLPTGDDPLIFIGKGGATIQKLQGSTGAKFHLNRGTNMLTISGLEDAVQLGLAAARSILAAEAEKKAAEVEESVTWGSDAIKAVIGRGGANIRAAQEATGTRIDADVNSGTLVIVGSADQVAIALTMCKNAAFGEVNEVIELSSRNAVNLIFGQNFQTIRSLQDSTGCKLDIARGSTTLNLSGSSDAVAKAKANIHALLDTNRGFEMTIEVSKVGAVYGKGGETLRSIENKTGTQIDVVRGPTHATISVMGTAEASGRARNMLQRAIDGDVELKPGEVAEEIALGLATAAVIGRGGSNVALLEKKHGVKVNVRSELQKARVVGKPNNVAEAVKEIDAIVKPIMKRAEDQKKVDDAVKAGDSEWQIKSQQADDAEGW